jgi:hypothetical protein
MVVRVSSLRDRIAAVLIEHPDRWAGTCCEDETVIPDGGFSTQDEWAEHVADAVIRELGLRREPRGDQCRFVTDWQKEDECHCCGE